MVSNSIFDLCVLSKGVIAHHIKVAILESSCSKCPCMEQYLPSVATR
jgi:hypothetical protein